MILRLSWYGVVVVGMVVAVMTVHDAASPMARLFSWSLMLALLTIVVESLNGAIQRLLNSRKNDGKRWADCVPDGTILVHPVPDTLLRPNLVDPRHGLFLNFIRPATQTLAGGERDNEVGLLGHVLCFAIFLEDRYHPWKDGETAAGLKSLKRACRWIEREAIRWKAPVKLGVAMPYLVIRMDEFQEEVLYHASEIGGRGGAEHEEWIRMLWNLSRSVIDIGFKHFDDFANALEARVGDAKIAWLIFPRQGGRSYAIPRGLPLTDGRRVAICYAAQSNFAEQLRGVKPRVDSAVIAHETLHLFGASDKYDMPLGQFPKGSVSGRDIMRMTERKLSKLGIETATAVELGWARWGRMRKTRDPLPSSE